MKQDNIYIKIKEMFPDAPDQFINAMYHNIKGKQYLWREEKLNDDSISDVNIFGVSD